MKKHCVTKRSPGCGSQRLLRCRSHPAGRCPNSSSLFPPLAAAQAGLPIYEYTPMQVKQAVTGYGKAVKKQVQEMTRILLHLPAIPKPDDTADALAMAITFCHTNGSQLNRFVRRVPGPI